MFRALSTLTGGQGVVGSNPIAPTTLGAVNIKFNGSYGSLLFLYDPNQLVLMGMVWYHFWAPLKSACVDMMEGYDHLKDLMERNYYAQCFLAKQKWLIFRYFPPALYPWLNTYIK